MTKEAFSFKRFIFALLIGLAGAVAGAFLPGMLVAAVALVAYIGVCWGYSYAAIALVFTAGGAVLGNLSEPVSMAALGALSVGASVFLIAGLKRKWPYRSIVFVLALASLAAMYLSIGLPQVIAGKEPYAGVVESLKSFGELYGDSAVLREEIAGMADTVPLVFYGILINFAEAAAFFTVIFAKLLCTAGKAELRPMARFREWQLPSSLKIGLPVLAVGIVIMFIARFAGASTMLYTVAYMLLPLFGATGLGCMLFVAERRGKGFLTVIAILMTVMAPFFTALLGVFDLYSGLRKRMQRMDRLVKEAFERAEKENRNTVTVDFGDGRGPQVIAVRKNRVDDAFFDDRSGEEQEKNEPENGNDEGPDNGEDNNDSFGDNDNGGGEA